jgi:23S rRNA-/tRNA-specific pseudouridylate synthase
MDQEATLVELRPTTGRRHQLRLHLSSINHPISKSYHIYMLDRANRISSFLLYLKLEILFMNNPILRRRLE